MRSNTSCKSILSLCLSVLSLHGEAQILGREDEVAAIREQVRACHDDITCVFQTVAFAVLRRCVASGSAACFQEDVVFFEAVKQRVMREDALRPMGGDLGAALRDPLTNMGSERADAPPRGYAGSGAYAQRAETFNPSSTGVLSMFGIRLNPMPTPPFRSPASITAPVAPNLGMNEYARAIRQGSPASAQARVEARDEGGAIAEPSVGSAKVKGGKLYSVWFGTNRAPLDRVDESKGYQALRDSTIHFGRCDVFVPLGHAFGSTGSGFLVRQLTGNMPLEVRRTQPLSEANFLSEVRQKLKASEDGTLLIYIHGFNNTFNETALRAAQIGYDLEVNGAVAFYSWPSRGDPHDYAIDIGAVEAAEESMGTFISTMAKQSGAQKVHIVAHSMGNLGLIRAINRATTLAALSGVKFGQIFLAAPDVDIDLFKQLSVIYPQLSERTTLYVSSRDRALEGSSWLRDMPRAGYSPPIASVKGIDTIEVSNIDVGLLGHTYFAEAADMLYDMHDLLIHNSEPRKRTRLQKVVGASGDDYYIFKK